MPNKPLLLLLVLLLLTTVHGGLTINTDAHSSLGDVIISDGVDDHIRDHPPPVLPFFASTEESCKQTYGFMPCTTTIIGNLFLIVVYGYLMFLAAKCLSTGTEIMLEILGPGYVGGLILPVLDAFPDAMLVLVSGVSGSTEYAQYKVSVGMGLLAGTSITLLTMVWGSCVVAGKCDLQHVVATDNQDTKGLSLIVAKDNQDTKGFSLTGSGISTDDLTGYTARIMAISIIPFIIVQIPQALNSATGRHLAVLISFIISLLLLISYCLFQVSHPWIQKRRIAYAKHKHVISGLLRHIKMRALGRLHTEDGEVNREVLEKVFTSIDGNSDGRLERAELKALIIGIQFEEIGLDRDDAVEKVMKEFDTSQNDFIDFDEFVAGTEKWLKLAKHSGNHGAPLSEKFLNDFHQQTKREHDILGNQSDEVAEGVENPRRIMIKSVLMLLLGTIIAAVFADPLVDAVDNLSSATSIPSYSISFIVLPFATNISEWVSTVTTASKKKGRTASLSFSEIYGVVTMNNLLCTSVFSALVYFRGLTWDFSAEVLVILIVCIVMGAFASFPTTQLWTSLVAFLLYPFSLALIYVLDYVLGWS